MDFLAIQAAAVTQIDRVRRRLSGTLLRAGEVGLTDAGPVRVDDPSLLEWPEDLALVDLTREHELEAVRGHLALVDVTPERVYIAAAVAAGQAGDDALTEAANRTRAGFSYRVERPILSAPGPDGVRVLLGGLVTSIGQVTEPAYNSARIDHIAASRTPQTPGSEPGTTTQGDTMNEDQLRRLTELRSQDTLTAEERAELEELVLLEHADATAPAAAPVAASVPRGLPAPRARIRERGTPLQQLVRQITRGLQDARQGGSALPAISAAFSDVTSTDHTGNVEEVAWSGELWSGLEYEPTFSDLLTADTLNNFEGKGWRFEITPQMQDYAGDKSEVPSGGVTTVASTYEASRMAVGVDIDRKFYDFPNEAFVRGLLERVRESWEIQLDGKARAYILNGAVEAGRPVEVALTETDATVTATAGTFTAGDVGKVVVGPGIPAGAVVATFTDATHIELDQAATATGATTVTLEYAASTSLLKGAARVAQSLGNTRVGRAHWIAVNDEDLFGLLDIAEKDLPAFLDLYGIDPRNFRGSPYVPAGEVYGGVRPAAKLRTLPGSPIRVSAQHLANGGIDEAFFGYWATETHHPRGIAKTTWAAA